MYPDAPRAVSAPAVENESLVTAPFLDLLARSNQEQLEKTRANNKKERDTRRISCYIHQKFPYANSDKAIPPKEFPAIAKRARNYYLTRTAGASLWALASTGGIFKGFSYMILVWPPTVGLFFGGLGIAALAATSLVFAIRKTVRFYRILTGKERHYYS